MRLLWLAAQITALVIFLVFLGLAFVLDLLRLFVLGIVEFIRALGD